jgi:acetyl-CoA synthetase
MVDLHLTKDPLIQLGLSPEKAETLCQQVTQDLKLSPTKSAAWQHISQTYLKQYPFNIHLYIFSLLFPHWHHEPEEAPAFIPTESIKTSANITQFMAKLNQTDIYDFHQWSYQHYQDFWMLVVQELNIIFDNPYTKICDLTQGIAAPLWFKDATLNIVNSCFTAPKEATAIIYLNKKNEIVHLTYHELN